MMQVGNKTHHMVTAHHEGNTHAGVVHNEETTHNYITVH